MAQHTPSLPREMLKLTIQYLAVAFASIPAGVVYILLFRASGNHNVSLVIAVTIGVISGGIVWKLIDKRMSPQPVILCQQPISNNAQSNTNYEPIAERPAASGLAVAFVVVYVMTVQPPTVVFPGSSRQSSTSTSNSLATS